MRDLKSVHGDLQIKTRERKKMMRAFQDELAQNREYQEMKEQLEKMREKKKSIENATKAEAWGDAGKLDLLRLEIKDGKHLLSDIALTMYAEGKPVEIVDADDVRWLPEFSVKFKKDQDSAETAKEKANSRRSESFADDKVPQMA
ncbi:hypothetical protein A3C96_02140 [Candidatus Uhrbacteria bacterium RIFCSPHIGHO2_02_FULL_60_10]|uniref:Uncharacterized protein n=1 Tax=Candidatus Uhrbacteria bacterium RIFCSPHIGHO2_02_FULL_60_10 TaxID=1802392 RepID=A0A1F7U7D0_9BACT|nr:MAG: hypothetical protein A3C96_02140 [Candidatus Uhrbacteria bacterium RIFCSPHIGHO2_02_FULL_60_10]